jgi:hypothetical protein
MTSGRIAEISDFTGVPSAHATAFPLALHVPRAPSAQARGCLAESCCRYANASSGDADILLQRSPGSVGLLHDRRTVSPSAGFWVWVLSRRGQRLPSKLNCETLTKTQKKTYARTVLAQASYR